MRFLELLSQTHRCMSTSSILATTCLLLALLAPSATVAQPTYSIDFQGPTINMPDSATTTPIGAGDILNPGAGTPAMAVSAAALGIVPSGATGQVEIDALSYGRDALVSQLGGPSILFSVDEFAAGIVGAPAPPNVTSEGVAGNQEASADVFSRLAMPPLPIGPGPVFGNTGIIDGNGVAPFFAPGSTLIEPNPPSLGLVPDVGDNLDALGCNVRFNRVYFSLDAAYLDPLEGAPVNSGTAAANGFAPGDILLSTPGGTPVVWASHTALGLGPQDDIDALILQDNGNGVFDPPAAAFDWMSGGADMVLFSVRRYSPLVGTFDAIFGQRIEEGDILTVTGNGPGIVIAAEALGLRTVRSYGPGPYGFGDELDALSVPPCP